MEPELPFMSYLSQILSQKTIKPVLIYIPFFLTKGKRNESFVLFENLK